MAWGGNPPAHAADATVGLGTASSYAVLAGSDVTNTGATTISGDLGVSPGTAVTGFPPGIVTNGATHAADAVALQAKDDLTTAYDDAAGRSTTTDLTGTDLGGQTLAPGVYEDTSDMQLTGTLTLDAQGDPDAVFVLKAGSTLVTASGAGVQLINGASPCRVFWQVGSSATLGTGTQLVGTVMALTSATLQTGATVQGRILARNGAVTLDTNDITVPACGGAPTTSTTSTSASTSTATPTSSTATATPSGGDSSAGIPTQVAVIPSGHPHTGMTAGSGGDGPWLLLGLGALVAAGAAALAFAHGRRTPRQH
ncbi:hypothetical protein NLS1_12260 [Nocardioides sp. LS1]|nr:hypothetical protein NLS1_12260 [Nocardioides sp. LS1]